MSAATNDACWKRIGIWGDRSCPELPTHGHCRNCPVYSAGAASLLDTEVSAEYLAAGARLYAQAKTSTRIGTQSAVVFRVAGEWLALPAGVFQEIAPIRPVHSLPHRRDALVSGLVNVRGELLVCVSLPVALGLGAAGGAAPETARHAVVGRGAERFVFAADEVAALHRYDEADVAPVPATLAHAQAVHTRGILQWQGKPVGLLDDGLLFRSLNRGLA
ncbi:MAG: chemotaxis protein CheW [Undibacterium sp.]|nr:chemotaxis protein CheW [Opitutaceae bacterium]